MKKALRIEIEGTDGAGKTTGLKYLIEQLQQKGSRILETREVGSPLIPTCVKLRELVLAPESNMTGEAMELVFAAMRVENDVFYKKVESDYDFIISDRGLVSHLAYGEHNTSKQFTADLFTNCVQKITDSPDMVIYFAVDTDVALKRRTKRGTGMDVIEMKGVEFQEKVRKSFAEYITELPSNVSVYVVDANGSLDDVKEQLGAIVSNLLESNKSLAW